MSSLNNLTALVRPILSRSAALMGATSNQSAAWSTFSNGQSGGNGTGVGAELRSGVQRRGGAKIPRPGGVEVGRKITRDRLLGGMGVPPLAPAVAVIDPPHAEGESFAHVAEHDGKARIFVEQ